MKIFRKTRKIDEENPYGMSIGDMMASLLLVIILVLFAVMLRLQTFIEDREKEIQAVDKHQVMKRDIIHRLVLDLSKYNIKIDRNTGVVTISEGVLFDFGKYNIKPSGEQFLRNFVSDYVNVLLEKTEISSQVALIIIEGHTDIVGSYESNLELSLNRARSVANYIFSGRIDNLPHREELQTRLTVNGRSFSDPCQSNETEAGRSANRRVEFKFRLVDWDVVNYANSNKRQHK